MSSRDQENIEDVEAILADCARLHTLAQHDPKAALEQSDPWLMLPHPSGVGSMLASKESSDRLWRLTERALASRGLERRIDLDRAKVILQTELVKRFVGDGRPIDQSQVSRLLSWAAKSAERGCETYTYYIPVRFTFTEEPDSIDLGPVRLLTTKFAASLFSGEIKGYLKKEGVSGDRKWARRHLKSALEYYRAFKWVAEVKITGCDEKTAHKAALRAVSSAIDCLHVILTRRYTDKLRIGGIGVPSDQRASFMIDGTNALHVSTSSGSLDQIGFGEGWSKQLEREDIAELIRLAGIALESCANLTITRPMSERYLDAAMWFGEAVRDEVLSSRAVKYVTAIERIVTAGDTENIIQTVATRTADLLFDPDNPEKWQENRESVIEAYGLRSDLVHGSISPFDEGVRAGVGRCGDLAEQLLVATLYRFGDQTLQFDKISNKQYAAWFRSVRKYVGRCLEELIGERA